MTPEQQREYDRLYKECFSREIRIPRTKQPLPPVGSTDREIFDFIYKQTSSVDEED